MGSWKITGNTTDTALAVFVRNLLRYVRNGEAWNVHTRLKFRDGNNPGTSISGAVPAKRNFKPLVRFFHIQIHSIRYSARNSK
jgi:hypothetical protein